MHSLRTNFIQFLSFSRIFVKSSSSPLILLFFLREHTGYTGLLFFLDRFTRLAHRSKINCRVVHRRKIIGFMKNFNTNANLHSTNELLIVWVLVLRIHFDIVHIEGRFILSPRQRLRRNSHTFTLHTRTHIHFNTNTQPECNQ